MKAVLAAYIKNYYSVAMRSRPSYLVRPSLGLILLAALVVLLWGAGGASRGDALGQAIVRGGAWLIIIVAVLAGPRADFNIIRPVAILMIVVIAIPLVQLIPLFPTWWRWSDIETLTVPGRAVDWRPLTIVPGATMNALGSLVVPAAIVLLFAQIDDRDRQSLLTILLAIVVMSVLVGLFQFSGAHFNNPFVNDVPGSVSSIFANRNHFALLVAVGCVLAPAWGLSDRQALYWRGPVAAALVLLFLLVLLAIGSRSGLVLGAIALMLSGALFGKGLKRQMRQLPTWLQAAFLATVVATIVVFVFLSFVAGRVETVDRLVAFSIEEDLRVRARPTLLAMIEAYFPFGSGLGSFDSAFRIHEPTSLLAVQYFNQAHNDYLGIALDVGLLGLIVLTSAIGWWAYATLRVLRSAEDGVMRLARLGSALLMLIFIASVTDYPTRTPLIMAVAAVSALWLAAGSRRQLRPTLPQPVRDV